MKYLHIFLFSFLLLFNCKKNKTVSTKPEKIEAPEMTIAVNRNKPAQINETVKKGIQEWKAYFELQNYLERFENASPNQSLSYAKELNSLVGKLRSRTQLKEFNRNSFTARINVLRNEVLRLYDMTKIPSITAKEVNTQVDKIFSIYGNINVKMNTIFLQKKFEQEIDLDNFFEKNEMNTEKMKN